MKIITKWKRSGLVEDIYLNDIKIGSIKRVRMGWLYVPKDGYKVGKVFYKISDCENSLCDEFL